jgi:anti-anti-sigma factor
MDAAERPERNHTLRLAEIEPSDQSGVRVVAVAGELDISNIGELERATFALPNEALGAVLDLGSATYIDSATLGLVFKLCSRLGKRGQALCVVCANDSNARRVLDLAGFDRKRTHEDRDAAIAMIKRAMSRRD